MSAELERHLRASFGRLPKPGRDATARARASALRALGPSEEWRPRGLLVLTFVVIFGVGAGAVLAATGKLHVDIGTQQPAPAPVLSRLKVPAGTHGLAVVAGGRLWLSARNGVRIEGRPAATPEVSPRGAYAGGG